MDSFEVPLEDVIVTKGMGALSPVAAATPVELEVAVARLRRSWCSRREEGWYFPMPKSTVMVS